MGKIVKLPETYDRKPVELLVYRWGGKWGPFKVKIPCGECTLTTDVIQDTLETELANAEVEFKTKDWLTHMLEASFKGARHAPCVLINGKVVFQGGALNRGLLAELVMNEHVQHFPLEGTHLFGKENCKFCRQAKADLDHLGIDYTYQDVVKNPGAMYEMLARVKPIVGPKTPITMPQIWIDGSYVGGADALREKYGLTDRTTEHVADTPSLRAAQAARRYWDVSSTPAAASAR
ncbi:MAG: glutaredoxin domain-containing protein [Pseudomonadota bacterium]